MNESRGVAGVLVLAGVLLSAHVAEGGDLSALSTPELERLVKAGDARVAAALGKHKSVIVQGEITDPNERLLLLVGTAIPNGSGFEGFGIHVEASCLMVQNPKGRISAGSYMDGPPFGKDLFYLGEGRATNAFGTSVSCSIYGGFDELPANIRAAVKKASEDVRPLREELDRRLAPERQAAAAVKRRRNERIQEIDARIAELQHQGHARPGSREEDDRVTAVYREREALSDERRMLLNGTDPGQERMKETAKKKTEQVEQQAERQIEHSRLKVELEQVTASLAEADGRCKSARARTMAATRSQSMGMGTTDEEINRVFAEETSTCKERGRLSVKKVALETDIRRMGGGAADESTAMAATPRPATEIHPTSVGSSMPPRPIATRSPAEEALDRGDWATAYAAYGPQAEAGDSDAQVRLGVLYYDALGRKQDFVLAESWFRKAAQRGSAEAKYRLALLFSEGRKGAPWDLEAAHRFLAESAPTYPEAAYKLGRFYWDGIGVPEDRIKAREWMEKAAAKGDSSAIDWMRSQK